MAVNTAGGACCDRVSGRSAYPGHRRVRPLSLARAVAQGAARINRGERCPSAAHASAGLPSPAPFATRMRCSNRCASRPLPEPPANLVARTSRSASSARAGHSVDDADPLLLMIIFTIVFAQSSGCGRPLRGLLPVASCCETSSRWPFRGRPPASSAMVRSSGRLRAEDISCWRRCSRHVNCSSRSCPLALIMLVVGPLQAGPRLPARADPLSPRMFSLGLSSGARPLS